MKRTTFPKNSLPRSRNRPFIIAIDGPAGSGKSSTAKALAAYLKLPYIDTGAMYRALTLEAMRRKISFESVAEVVRLARKMDIGFGPMKKDVQTVYVDGKDVTKAIRTPELTKNVVYVAREPKIRAEMVRKQRILGRKEGAVMDGRDIGTVVFPKAHFKFYFDAEPRLRARRRYKELLEAGKKVPFKRVLEEIRERDKTDRERKQGALRVAKGAKVIDTTGLTIQATIDKILAFLGADL